LLCFCAIFFSKLFIFGGVPEWSNGRPRQRPAYRQAGGAVFFFLMAYWVYILKSLKSGRYYTGYCRNLKRRLKWHNLGLTFSTKRDVPWKIVYKEKFDTKQEAIIREQQIKRYKGGNAFKRLLGDI